MFNSYGACGSLASFRKIDKGGFELIEYTGFIYCPKCGGKNIEIYEKNALCCKSCGYIYFHNTCAATAGIVEIEGGVLLTIRAHEPKAGMYDLPGGFMDYDESAEQALVREIREELDIDVKIKYYLTSFPNRYIYKNVTYFTADLFFVCVPADENVRITGNEEISTWKIFKPDALPWDKIGFESNVKALKLYCESLRTAKSEFEDI